MTYCTGKRKCSRSRSCATGTVSRWASTLWPWYHGVAGLLVTQLSPFFALTGKHVMVLNASFMLAA